MSSIRPIERVCVDWRDGTQTHFKHTHEVYGQDGKRIPLEELEDYVIQNWTRDDSFIQWECGIDYKANAKNDWEEPEVEEYRGRSTLRLRAADQVTVVFSKEVVQ
jgi:hypothetical protein